MSKQYLLDCATATGSKRCQSSCSPISAFTYFSHFGVISEILYPYNGKAKQCLSPLKKRLEFSSKTFHLPPYDEMSLKIAISNIGPISVNIHVSGNFIIYKSRVFYDPMCSEDVRTNHAALVIGYGTDPNGLDYWLVKNSWGTEWGENGYIRMAKIRRAQKWQESLWNCVIPNLCNYHYGSFTSREKSLVTFINNFFHWKKIEI